MQYDVNHKRMTQSQIAASIFTQVSTQVHAASIHAGTLHAGLHVGAVFSIKDYAVFKSQPSSSLQHSIFKASAFNIATAPSH